MDPQKIELDPRLLESHNSNWLRTNATAPTATASTEPHPDDDSPPAGKSLYECIRGLAESQRRAMGDAPIGFAPIPCTACGWKIPPTSIGICPLCLERAAYLIKSSEIPHRVY
jgi:hypothetical protein